MYTSTYSNKNKLCYLMVAIALLFPTNYLFPFAFIFAGDSNGLNVVAHPIGYNGTGGVITIDVGIDPTSANATDMEISVQNSIGVFNGLISNTPNLEFGSIPGNQVDFESVFLHELGHSLGLAHCNAATESGLANAFRNYTKATDGIDNSFNLDNGVDNVIGSNDDVRGDDVNLNYFKIADNNPFTAPGANIYDATTYSRDIANLPSGLFSANADRDVGSLLSFSNTEAVMQQGSFFGELQQSLTQDDIAGLRYAMSGLDRTQGTADDYTIVLNYVGLTTSADIIVDFDNNQTGFAVSQNSGNFIAADHIRISSPSRIFFNTGFNWYFSTALKTVENNIDLSSLVEVYPNPTQNVVKIRNSRQINIDAILVYNSFGQLIKNKKVDNRNLQESIDLSGLSAGVYVVQIISRQGKLVKSIIKK